MTYWSIDRFEEGFAICVGPQGEWEKIPRRNLPEQCREGDCIYFDKNGKIFIDVEETNRRRQRIKELLNRLYKQ